MREAVKIGITVSFAHDQNDVKEGINITNYELIDNFTGDVDAIVLDESSILKSISGKIKRKLIDTFSGTRYKLCCTATPAPNDYIEIGNHAWFLEVCTHQEMLSMFFINANKEHTIDFGGKLIIKKGSNKGGTEWRIKHHAEERFFEWMSSWAMFMMKPSDLGYEDNGFVLPPLNIAPIIKDVVGYHQEDVLFFNGLSGITDRAKVRGDMVDVKTEMMKELFCNKTLDNSIRFDINFQHERDRKEGIQQEILQRESGQGKEAVSRLLQCEKGHYEQDTKKGVFAEVLCGTQAPMEQTNSRTTGEIQSDPPGEICKQQRISGWTEESRKGLLPTESPITEGDSPEKIWGDDGYVSGVDETTRRKMRDLRNGGERGFEDISPCGSLSFDGEDKGHSLHELQSCYRKDAGQPGTSSESGRLSQLVIWCGLDKEQRSAEKLLSELHITYSTIYGSLSAEEKEKRLLEWIDGKTTVMISKPKVCGYGLNLQCASNMVFFGLNDSWETFYQAIRREWRFGQKKPVNVYILLTSPEVEIYENIKRKELQATRLRSKMIDRMKNYEKGEIMDTEVHQDEYVEETVEGDGWKAMRGDSVLRLKEVPPESVDLTVYSPPFLDLFVYSNSDHDLGNCRTEDDFFTQYGFIVDELLRVTKPGRLSCVHTSDIPAMANRDGYIGLKDFPGKVIRFHQDHGWTFIGRAFIQKNPQAQAIRVKSKALLFVQMKKDSSHSRPALIDQILIFKKPGENAVPIEPVKNGELNNETWISWAHGIWTDINETKTLQYYCGRDPLDEKHVAPLQLETIERCIKLYSNPGETVLTPFMGIGSEAFMALKLGRKAIGIELKPSYYRIAVQNLMSIENTGKYDLFSLPSAEAL